MLSTRTNLVTFPTLGRTQERQGLRATPSCGGREGALVGARDMRADPMEEGRERIQPIPAPKTEGGGNEWRVCYAVIPACAVAERGCC